VSTVLETTRLTLRRFAPDDVELLVELDSDPLVMLYITGGRVTPRGEIEEHELPAFLAHYARWPRWGFFAAEEKATANVSRVVSPAPV
jgi:RimJ/RimL family protein N-acetyltransferase